MGDWREEFDVLFNRFSEPGKDEKALLLPWEIRGAKLIESSREEIGRRGGDYLRLEFPRPLPA